MRIIDGDGHIHEDHEGIKRHLPEPFRRMVSALSPGGLGPFPPMDHMHTPFRDTAATLANRGRVGPEEWLEFLDDVGIESTVLYPSLALSYGWMIYPDVTIAVTRAYNDWLHEAYLQRSPRFKGMALIPMQEPDAAVAELQRVVRDLGMCGAMLPATGLKAHLGAREYWPVFEAANALGCSIAIHGGSHNNMGMDHLDHWPTIHALGHPFGQLINFAGIVSNGVLERFPNLRIGFLEGGVSWLLMALERLDSSYGSFSQANPSGRFIQIEEGTKVSDRVKRHIAEGRIFIGCEGDELGLTDVIRHVGSSAFVYSSDFPHEVTNETCKEEIEELMENQALTTRDKENILFRNAERFYQLQPAAVVLK